MAGPVVNSLSGLLLERGGKVIQGCGGCPTLPFGFAFLGTGTFDPQFVVGTLTWDPTPIGGEFIWRYQGGDLLLCAGSTAPGLKLREIAFWCPAGSTNFAAEIVIVNGVLQFSYSTVGGALIPFVVDNPSGPRAIHTRTVGDDANFCDASWFGYLRLDVAL